MAAKSTKKHIPTDEIRQKVFEFVSFGVSEEEIARFFKIDPKTLRKYYREELDNAVLAANSKVANRLYNKAVNMDDTSAMIFWLKTRARWSTADAQKVADNTQALLEKLPELMAKKNAE